MHCLVPTDIPSAAVQQAKVHPPDLVVCPEANPLGDGAVLLGLLGQLALDEKRLLGRLQIPNKRP